MYNDNMKLAELKEFDHNGLLLAEYQGKIFEKSLELNCSSAIFIRRFLHSNLLEELDKNLSVLLSLDPDEAIQSLLEQYGDSNYGKVKYSRESLFWMGYMYRYISYTREERTPFVMKTFTHKQMNDVYYVFHTQDPEWVIRSLLEMNHLNENYFDKNYRLKQIMLEKWDRDHNTKD